MPPFMRQSNAQPLTLANWQYELLMRWADHAVERARMLGFAVARGGAGVRRLSPSAAARRASVLARISAAAEIP
jgi:hypothetical protein